MKTFTLALLLAAASAVAPPALAQSQQQAPPQPAKPASIWASYPRMILERTYAGPLQDTIIQRWRDPTDGTVCFLYLPVAAHHSAPMANGFVEYGANTIGSISCGPGAPRPAGR